MMCRQPHPKPCFLACFTVLLSEAASRTKKYARIHIDYSAQSHNYWINAASDDPSQDRIPLYAPRSIWRASDHAAPARRARSARLVGRPEDQAAGDVASLDP